MDTKTCKACNEEKPVNEFYPKKSRCKKCHNRMRYEKLLADPERHAKKKAYKLQWLKDNEDKVKHQRKEGWAEYRKENPKRPKLSDEEKAQRRKEAQRRYAEKRRAKRNAEKAKRESEEGRTCKHCGEAKPVDEFARKTGKVCKACKNQPNVAYMKRRVKQDIEYRKLRRHYKAIDSHRRRGAEGSHTLEEWEALKRQYNYTCLCCGKQEPEIELTRDHVVPVTKDGNGSIENIQPLCRSCNSRKHAKEIDYRGTPA